MKKILIMIFALIAVHSNAQITINNNDFASANDTMRLSIASALTVVDLTQTGANFTWDFTTLQADSQVVDSFLTVGSTGFVYGLYFGNFGGHTSNIAQKGPNISAIPGIPVTDPFVFYNKTSSLYEQTGFGATLSGITLPVGNSNNDVIYNFPLNYGAMDTSNSSFSLSVPGTGTLTGTQTRTNNVDGWGTLETPFGTFDVLREVSTILAHDSLKLDTAATGFAFDQPLTREYKWIGKNQMEPLLQINTQEILGTEVVSSIRYRDSVRYPPVPTGLNQLSENAAFTLYPNPAKGNSTLTFYASENCKMQISILDVSGKTLSETEYSAKPGINQYTVSTADFSSGFYYLRAEQEGKILKTLPLLIAK